MRAWAYIDWEPNGAAYLAIARSDQEVERLPLTKVSLLDLIAQAATALRAGPRLRAATQVTCCPVGSSPSSADEVPASVYISAFLPPR